MNTCATCKWWAAPKPIHGMENASLPERGGCRQLRDENDNIVIDGYDVSIYTRPDFGCTLWEAKEKP